MIHTRRVENIFPPNSQLQSIMSRYKPIKDVRFFDFILIVIASNQLYNCLYCTMDLRRSAWICRHEKPLNCDEIAVVSFSSYCYILNQNSRSVQNRTEQRILKHHEIRVRADKCTYT